jgi:hypothetical protein
MTPVDFDVVLGLEGVGEWGYYMVNHDDGHRCVFWLDDVKPTEQFYALESEYRYRFQSVSHLSAIAFFVCGSFAYTLTF